MPSPIREEATVYRIVFSDVDGTLLTSSHTVSPLTQRALQALRVPFVIVSARSPGGIRPIMRQYGFCGPMIAYSGALIVDADGYMLYQRGMAPALADETVRFLEAWPNEVVWNLYAGEDWIVKSRRNPRVAAEERIVHAQSRQGTVRSVAGSGTVHKILCMCAPTQNADVQAALRQRFPQLSIVQSAPDLIEIMAAGVSKADAVHRLCAHMRIAPEQAIAFGDHYNDVDMLHAVGCGVVMGNAPADIRAQFAHVTADHDHDGIAQALAVLLPGG